GRQQAPHWRLRGRVSQERCDLGDRPAAISLSCSASLPRTPSRCRAPRCHRPDPQQEPQEPPSTGGRQPVELERAIPPVAKLESRLKLTIRFHTNMAALYAPQPCRPHTPFPSDPAQNRRT